MTDYVDLISKYGWVGAVALCIMIGIPAILFWRYPGLEFTLGPAKFGGDQRKLIGILGVGALAAAMCLVIVSRKGPSRVPTPATVPTQRISRSPRPSAMQTRAAVLLTPTPVVIYVTPSPKSDDRRARLREGIVSSWVERRGPIATHYFVNSARNYVYFQLALSHCANVRQCESISGQVQPGATATMAAVRSDDDRTPIYTYSVFARTESLEECIRFKGSMLVLGEPKTDAERVQRAQAEAAEQRNEYQACRLEGIDEQSGVPVELEPR